jgi:hypothetical protein
MFQSFAKFVIRHQMGCLTRIFLNVLLNPPSLIDQRFMASKGLDYHAITFVVGFGLPHFQ